jgi:hypothetical protein
VEHRPDKAESRRIRVAIRHVLVETWDPIGLGWESPDEYDAYLGDIYELLLTRAPEEKVVEYLLWVTTERMGLTQSEIRIARTNAAVQELMRIPFPPN